MSRLALNRHQHGTTLVLVALMAVGLAAATGVAADAGMLYYRRTQMQVAADAAALAGARGLATSSSHAVALAQQYAQDNGYALAASDVRFPAKASISVTVHGPAPMLLSALLGMATPDVSASADGDLERISQSGGIRPFGIPDGTFQQGREYLLEQGAGCSLDGNFQALALGGTGAAVYEQNVVQGSSQAFSVGQDVDTEPGNMVGPTDFGIAQMVGSDETPFEQALTDPTSTPRVITVALLDPLQWADVHGRSRIDVTGFARFYVIDAQSGAVDARFLDRVTASTIAASNVQYAEKLVL